MKKHPHDCLRPTVTLNAALRYLQETGANMSKPCLLLGPSVVRRLNLTPPAPKVP